MKSSSSGASMQSALAQGRAFAHIAKFHPELTTFRRDLHANPELGFEEIYTSARVIEALKVCGVDAVHTGIGKTGVVALVHGKGRNVQNPGRMIGLRADMDALPMPEHNDSIWKSQKAGLMHACGHDGHTAMLIGAARYLAETRQFDGTAVLIFQPGEEGYAGARAMMQDGLFDRFPCEQIYAQHNSPDIPLGVIGVTPARCKRPQTPSEFTFWARADTAPDRINRLTLCWWRRTSSRRRKVWCRAICRHSTKPWSAFVPCKLAIQLPTVSHLGGHFGGHGSNLQRSGAADH